MEKDYSYNRFGSQGVRVGQAVSDILAQEQPEYTVEEILDELGKGIMNYIQEAAEEGYEEFDTDFYIIHTFRKKLGEMGVENVLMQKAVAYVDGPTEGAWYMRELPTATKTLYQVDRKNGVIKLLWTVPGWEDCKSILKNPALYDPSLVQWVKDATADFNMKVS